MRVITLTKAGITLTMEAVPDLEGWFSVAGVDLAAREKVYIFLQAPAMDAARVAADECGGAHVKVYDEQVVASVPMDEQQ